MKRSDLSDGHVLDLARQWSQETAPRTGPGVVRALMAEGVPEKVALAKVEHMITRRLLECGVSPYYAWPATGGGSLCRCPT